MAHSALFEHVKLRKLCRLLSIPRPHAIGYLECLTHYVGDHHYDGDLSSLSDDDIEEAAEWQGEPGKFLAACIEVRLIDRDAAGTRLHDWLDWRPDYVRKRAWRAEQRKNRDLQPKTAHNGAQRRTTAHNGAQRRTTAAARRTTAHNGAQRPPEPSRAEPSRAERLYPPV